MLLDRNAKVGPGNSSSVGVGVPVTVPWFEVRTNAISTPKRVS